MKTLYQSLLLALGGPNPTNLTGDYNTASGYGALNSNTGGSHNTASGVAALGSNQNGSYNTATG